MFAEGKSNMSIIQLEHISKKYADKTIFRDLSINVNEGEFLGIQGGSGTGKSTLLNIIGLLEEGNGSIMIDGEAVDYRNNRQVQRLLRRKIGYLFQNFALIDDQTVKENLYLAMPKMSETKRQKLCLNALSDVGLDNILNKKIYQLSGGEQQRIAVARLILHRCKIVLADEPTGSLDKENADKIIDLLWALNQQGRTVIMVSHDPNAFRYCTRIVKIENQGLVDATPKKVENGDK